MDQATPSRESRAWLDAVRAHVLTTDTTGRVTYANDAALRLLGDCVVGAPLGQAILHDGRALVAPAILLERGLGILDCRLACDGEEVQIEIRARDWDEHDDAGYVIVVHKISAEHQREIRKFERLAAMGTMVAGFAHEVLNPVASLRSLTESLDEELVDAGMKLAHTGRMLRVLERVERLVRTSLQFGRPSPPRLARHRPWALLSSALSSIGPRLRAMGQDVRVEVDPDLPDVCVDDAQITQVLVIFLNNALDATMSPRKVLLRARWAREDITVGGPAMLRLEVEDEGPGISREDLARIFDPFFTTKATGTGLGLPIAQQLVNENGGRLDVASSPEGRTRFAVVLHSA